MPTVPGTTGSRLSFTDIQNLWVSNGGSVLAAPIMAAIAIAESTGLTNNLNPVAPDYSVGLWQINYYGSLAGGRTAAYGTPAQLASDPNAQAKAAIAISGNGRNLQPWSTWTSGAAQKVLNAQGIPALPSLAAQNAGLAQASAPSEAGATASGSGDEGSWTMPGPIPNVSRRLVRKVLGGAVGVGSVLVAGAGLFLLVGKSVPLPGPAGAVSGVLSARKAGRHEEAMVTSKAAKRATQKAQGEEESARQSGRDQVGERRRAKQQAKADETRSARAAGERAARAAGDF
jgi:hypothetical protein